MKVNIEDFRLSKGVSENTANIVIGQLPLGRKIMAYFCFVFDVSPSVPHFLKSMQTVYIKNNY
jgi:hypothetical protein